MTIFASGRGAICRRKAVAAAAPIPIGTITQKVNSTAAHTGDNVAHTVTSDTDLVVVLILLSGTVGNNTQVTSLTSNQDGALTVERATPNVGASAGDPRSAAPGYAIGWFKPTTKGVSHTITFAVDAADPMDYSAMFIRNYKNIDAADPIGFSESFCSANTDNQNTLTRAATLEKANSVLLSAAASQGNDTDPFSALEGATLLVTGDTGGGSTSLDGGFGVAEEEIATSGSHNYGLSWSSADGHGMCCVEVRGP